jgi:amino-acid N-acetyltransferase
MKNCQLESGTAVRKANLNDVEKIVSFVNSLAHDGTLLRRTPADVCATIDTFIVAEDEDGHFLGCVALYCYGPNLAEVRSVVVDPEARGQGVGHKLMTATLQKAAESGIECLCLFTRIPEFFRSYGFHEVPRSSVREKYDKDCRTCPRRFDCDEKAMVRGDFRPAPFIVRIPSYQGPLPVHA